MMYTHILLLASPSITSFLPTSSPAIIPTALCVYSHLAVFVRSYFYTDEEPGLG